MSQNEYAIKLSRVSNVSYDFIVGLTRITALSSENLYDFYCMATRFPTVEEINVTFKVGFTPLYELTKLNLLKQ